MGAREQGFNKVRPRRGDDAARPAGQHGSEMMDEMNRDKHDRGQVSGGPKPPHAEDLPPAAQRALKEAEERRKTLEAAEAGRPKAVGGRGGLDPVRYGDWEVKGRAVDF